MRLLKNNKGISLVEILVSVGIMSVAIGSSFQATSYLLQLNELNDNITPVMNSLEGIRDEIKNVPFDDISPNYHNTQFTLNELTNKGVPNLGTITVDLTEPSFLLKFRIVVCWRQGNRMIGEDANLNGVLDSGEDTNLNGLIDSPCAMETAVIFR
ncbi:MAG: prepilin-type N-terminal cleavage/methylation domain-containing protein [Candidatus Omnitrophota bacterium]